MVAPALLSSQTDEWATPQDLFDGLNGTFKFTLDPCATAENAKCAKFYTKEQDGLKQDWGGKLYGAIRHMAERLANGSRNARNIMEWPSCYCQPEPTRGGGMNTSRTTQPQASASSRGGSSSAERLTQHRSRPQSSYSSTQRWMNGEG